MLALLCRLLVVLVSLFRAVWDFLEGCLGFFTESSVPSTKRCFSLFTCQRLKGRVNTHLFFHITGGLDWLQNSGQRRGRSREITECALSCGAALRTQKGCFPNLSALQAGKKKTLLRWLCLWPTFRKSWISPCQTQLNRETGTPMRDKVTPAPQSTRSWLWVPLHHHPVPKVTFTAVGIHPGSTE